MHPTMTERPHAALSDRAALLSNLRTGGVASAPAAGPMELPPLHLGRDHDPASMQRLQQAQAQAQAYAQSSPLLAQHLAAQQQQQQAELVRLLALQQQQQQLLLLQTLQAQAAQQAQAIQAQQQQAAQTLQAPGLHPGYGDSQRHSWAPDVRRPASPRFPSRPVSSVGVGPAAGRPVSSADLAPSWRSGRRTPPSPPSIVIDDGSAAAAAAAASGVGPEDITHARRVQRDALLPKRMPRGPPTDATELAANNFLARANTKVRRDAIKVLAAGRH